MNDEHLLKFCIIDLTKIETKWVQRFAEGKSETDYLPIEPDIVTTNIIIDKTRIKLVLLVMGEHEYSKKLHPSYYRGSAAIILAFDKSNSKTLETIPDWLAEFRQHIVDPTIPIVLVGVITNSEEILTEEGEKLAETHEMTYHEINVKDGASIAQFFHGLIKTCWDKKKNISD